ncbi:MAG TPA: hypothetical protein PKE20_08150, partial [Promineifilum sp.]|nr:hypothetical protein [Promineifilum sp.]
MAANYPEADPIFFSTVYPGPAHDSSIALVTAAGRPPIGETARWADARYALVLPPERTLAVIPYSTPPHPAFIPLLEAIETIDLRPDDLDPRFTLYWLDGLTAAAALSAGGTPEQAGGLHGGVRVLGARRLRGGTRPGGRGPRPAGGSPPPGGGRGPPRRSGCRRARRSRAGP